MCEIYDIASYYSYDKCDQVIMNTEFGTKFSEVATTIAYAAS